MRHHHHYYDLNDKSAIVSHDHDYEHATHNHTSWVSSVLQGRPIFWDHDGTDCARSSLPLEERSRPTYWTDG